MSKRLSTVVSEADLETESAKGNSIISALK